MNLERGTVPASRLLRCVLVSDANTFRLLI